MLRTMQRVSTMVISTQSTALYALQKVKLPAFYHLPSSF
jgi:hypothetical protein